MNGGRGWGRLLREVDGRILGELLRVERGGWRILLGDFWLLLY